jgi:pilus assembly protein CpaD
MRGSVMTVINISPAAQRSRRPLAVNIALTALLALSVTGCIHERQGPQVAGWAITDPSERHPIMVSQQPSTLALKIPPGSYGLTPYQRAQLIDFAGRYHARNTGNSKLVIFAPSGGKNEVAVMQAVSEIRDALRETSFDDSSIAVEAHQVGRSAQPPVRVSYLQYVAEAPECGYWGSNVAEDPLNVGTPNLGCATQANFAAMVANPADLLGPRTMTPHSSERRDQVWEKYVKGDTTISKKSADERVQSGAK